jgi:hypothetical protein
MEGTMFHFDKKRENLAPRASLYCVWIRAHDGENAPLVQVWIDPSMAMFELQTAHNQPQTAMSTKYMGK